MLFKSNIHLLYVWKANISRLLTPKYWNASSNADMWKQVVCNLKYLLCLIVICHIFTVCLIQSPAQISWAWKILASSINHQIIEIMKNFSLRNKSLHQRKSPTLMTICLFKKNNHMFIPEEFGIRVFFVRINFLLCQCNISFEPKVEIVG